MEKIDLSLLSEEQIAYLSREWMRVKQQNRRARQAGLPATLTTHEWFRILDEYNGMCAYCKIRPFAAMEHLHPVQRGGGTTAENCVPSCAECNNRKGLKRAYQDEQGIFVLTPFETKRRDEPKKQEEASSSIAHYVSISTIATWMECSDDTVRIMAKRGDLESMRMGGSIRINLETFQKYLEEHRIGFEA